MGPDACRFQPYHGLLDWLKGGIPTARGSDIRCLEVAAVRFTTF